VMADQAKTEAGSRSLESGKYCTLPGQLPGIVLSGITKHYKKTYQGLSDITIASIAADVRMLGMRGSGQPIETISSTIASPLWT
jgi:hypothetical protein